MDLILWGVMVLGGALLGLVYITTSYHDGGKNLSVAGSPTRAEMPRAREEGLRGPLKANAPPQAATAAAIPKERTSPPTPAPSSRPQEALSESKSEGAGAGTGGQKPGIPKPTEGKGAPTPPPSGPKEVTIQETTNANGTIYSAQEIGEGTIVGKRGAADDFADFYKIRATGSRMRLRLEPVLKDQEGRFVMMVFDEAQRRIGEHAGEEDSPLTLEVKSQATYIIKLDLRKAPIDTIPYRLRVIFE